MQPISPEPAVIGSIADLEAIAAGSPPVQTAFIAPADGEFLRAALQAIERQLIEPVFVGNRKTMTVAAQRIGLDWDRIKVIEAGGFQEAADAALDLLATGAVKMVSKGQLPTSFVYRAMIRRMKQVDNNAIISVLTIWDLADCDHLVIITDTGANIAPDEQQKIGILDNALRAMKLLGIDKPEVIELISDPASLAVRGDSRSDSRTPSIRSYQGRYTLVRAHALKKILTGSGAHHPALDRLPHIMLVPDLNTGNVVAKLDFFIACITRVSFSYTPWGPVLLPSRADVAPGILRELVSGAALVSRWQRENADG
jgi:phosphate butyryltransferase